MEEQEMRIITLPDMRVASFYAYSSTPEYDAWNKLVCWAKAHGCWQAPPATRIFGFDNPSPSEGSPNRGYEFWLTVDPEVQADDEIKIKEIPSGLYGVMRCDVNGDPWDFIPAAWQKLVKWLESSKYHYGKNQCLEEHLSRADLNNANFVLDLYIPIVE
jgi:DNA gyrase inhibitor GyrI